jgi:hypothetical protein
MKTVSDNQSKRPFCFSDDLKKTSLSSNVKIAVPEIIQSRVAKPAGCAYTTKV